MKKIFFIIGTRPELIKCAPVIKKIKTTDDFVAFVCFTGQHKELIDETALFFGIIPDINLSLMQENQNPSEFIGRCLCNLGPVLEFEKPDMVLVQGDTSSVLAGALASFYKKIPIGHIEAGLRSFDMSNPFPEEMNRVLVSTMAAFHFAATIRAIENLKKENKTQNVFLTGNTVVDALQYCKEKIENQNQDIYLNFFKHIDFNKKTFLLTVHRRENFGEHLHEIVESLKSLSRENDDIQFIWPVHPNPNVKSVVYNSLSGIPSIYLFEPFTYPQLIWILMRIYAVITDSGGLQEESPSFNKPTLVLRKNTERMESIESGASKLIQVTRQSIIDEVMELCNNEAYYTSFIKNENPYGDGKASTKIVQILRANLK